MNYSLYGIVFNGSFFNCYRVVRVVVIVDFICTNTFLCGWNRTLFCRCIHIFRNLNFTISVFNRPWLKHPFRFSMSLHTFLITKPVILVLTTRTSICLFGSNSDKFADFNTVKAATFRKIKPLVVNFVAQVSS